MTRRERAEPSVGWVVLLYRLSQLLVPAALGTPAFILLRHRLRRSEHPALICAPLAVDVVNLPAPG